MEEGVLIGAKATEEKQLTPEEKMAICRRCPLFNSEMEICDSHLWMDPQTYKVSTRSRAGYVRGCGCLMSRKTKRDGSHCHNGRW